ncbi:hypothetical protein APX70_05955 [Pseudomonas syringae pv. maculicola]|uniref:Uncharacterized protein n=1 Tax=Pseudomonas syringae pv. maculicola TaxID=59511 RepID=A0A3M2ZAD7_PSEYM|nr:hypothetical protein APX70_05955 [Pseudomonas syringae pv. maculicola]
MRQWNETGFFQLVARCIEFFKGGRCLVDTGFLEDFRVDPQPVDAVDVHRHGHVIAIVLHGIGDFLVQQGVPLFGLGDVFQRVSVEQACGCPFLDIRPFDLGNAWRVTSNCTALEHGHGCGATAASDCAVFPDEAVFFNLRFQNIDCSFFATRRPPVHDFDSAFGFSSSSAQREQRSERDDNGET